MIIKCKHTLKGIENPFTQLVIDAINWVPEDGRKKNYLVLTKKVKTVSDLDNFVNRANVAWDAACEYIENGGDSVQFELLTGRDMSEPYAKLKFGDKFYKVGIPFDASGRLKLKEKFGDYYTTDISDAVRKWLKQDYTVTIERETDMTETNRYIIYKGKVLSVDSGEEETEVIYKLKHSHMFTYVPMVWGDHALDVDVVTEGRELCAEVTEFDDLRTEVLNVAECKLTKIGKMELAELDRYYREGRSKLQDAVFDDIMAGISISEEELQKLSGELGTSSPISAGNYPASSKILSQDKVRDVKKLFNIVKSWGAKAVISWKLDGCAVRLWYKGDKFVRAETKGKARDVTGLMRNVDGFDDVLYNRQIVSEPQNTDVEWFVTGEVVALNNRRSVVAGYLLRKDQDSDEAHEVAYENKLHFFAYDSDVWKLKSSSHYYNQPMRLYSEMLKFLAGNLHFSIVEVFEFEEEMFDKGRDLDVELRRPNEYDIDGLVIRANNLAKYASMGETEHHPKGSVAFKFEDTWYPVKPKLIYSKTGVNNVVKFIAEFDPIEIDGKSVKSAVFQPREMSVFTAHYETKLYDKTDGGYELRYHGEPILETEYGKQIEVCLRGKVIPQFRFCK